MTGASPPPDQHVRDAAVNDLDRTLFIEAGAGTGKTTMLVKRVVALVMSEGKRMEEIAAITFTEAAAAELRDRLAQDFETLAQGEDGERAKAAALALDAAAVTTLHGFARKILAEQPFSVGLPPLFDVADESSDRVAFDERWDRFRTTLLEVPEHEELVVRALSCGLSWKGLREAALQCHRNWDLLEGGSVVIPPRPVVDSTDLVHYLRDALNLAGQCRDPDDRLAVLLRTRTAGALETIGHASDEIDLLQIFGGLKLGPGQSGRKDNWPDGSKDAVVELLRAAEMERLHQLGITAQWVVHSLLGQLVAFTLEGANERRTSGHLIFHDLLVLACKVVRENASARAELHRRYSHLLIDEFQDTDPIQAELAMYLAADPDADFSRDWVDLPVSPGRLFFVGDPKQSIYRFRRADIELFMNVRDHVVDQALQLTANFRSRPGIVEWVNAIFTGLFGEGEPGMQPRYEPLYASVESGPTNPRSSASVILLGSQPIEGKADEVRLVQAREVVAAISTMHSEEWLVGDASKPLRYSDVAILVRTRTGLPTLVRAFEDAGVPYRLESSSLVYESSEVKQLLAILRAIDDPADAVSVLAALRSPAFGCGDDDLWRHHAQGGTWTWRVGDGDVSPVEQALAELSAAHERCWWQSVSALVSQVVVDRRLMALALAQGRPRESWRRIRFLLDQARLFDESNGGDLRGFLRWVDHQQEEGARVTEAIVPETDDDAVRVVTVHGSKGLQYPVVVLMGLQTKPNHQSSPLLFADDGPKVRLTPLLQSEGYQEAADHEADMERHEQRRLLYVAATRAQEVLLVSAHRDTTKATEATLAAQLVAQCDRHPGLWWDGTDLTVARPKGALQPEIEPTPDGPLQRAAFMSQRDLLLRQMAHPRTIGATGVRGLAQPDDVDRADVETLERTPSSVHRRGRAGTAVGRAVHAVLQVIDLETRDGLSELAHSQAVAEGVIGREAEIRQLVLAALDSDLIRQAVRSGRYWREIYVGVPVGERVLEGFIDILFETPDGLSIVDYKTDRLAQDGDAAEVAGRYRLQGASYALAAERALGKPVASCTFLFLRPEGAVPEAIDDLATAIAEATKTLSQPLHRVPA